MARPKADPMEVRSGQVKFRLSAIERAQLETRAEQAGKTVTDFARTAALGKPLKVVQHASPDMETRTELRRIGVNLNQIAKRLNQTGGHAPAALLEVIGKLDSIFDQWLDHGPENRRIGPQL